MSKKSQEPIDLPRDASRKLRDVEDALAHYAIGGDNITAALEALRELLATDKVVLYNLRRRPASDDLMVDRAVGVSLSAARWRSAFDEGLIGRGVMWGAYNVICPEPAQRNRVLRAAELSELTEGRVVALQQLVFERVGAAGFDAMRALVCDGPSLLAVVGILQPEATTEHQRDLLGCLLPAFRKRLAFERLVAESTFSNHTMAAAFEEIGGPAWLLAESGRVAHANAAGAARFDADRSATLAALAACAAGAAGGFDPRFKVTPLRGPDGTGRGHVVVERMQSAPRAPGDAARRFNLTPAQTRVLERVARGASNASIAAELGVAERTVEAHVTAILVKAQVPSRSALIVHIYADARAL